jgi:nucleotide-binding universal stress UspA family protein
MKILVPTAGPKPARENADYILYIAKKLKAEVSVIHILDIGEESPGGKEALSIFMEEAENWDVKVTTHMMEGNIVPTIVDFAEDENVNLIIMGASKGRIIADWIVTDILDKTKIPVVIIPIKFRK